MAAARRTEDNHDDGTLTPEAFAAGLRRFAAAPEVRHAWDTHGAAAAWEWEWEVVEANGQVLAIPYCVLKLTRPHPGAPSAAAMAEQPEPPYHPHDEEPPYDNNDDACLLLPAEQPPSSSTAPSSSSSPPPTPLAVDWELHVVYSDVFRVPGLWLAAAWPDGRPLTEAELAAALPTPPDMAFAAESGGQQQEQEQEQEQRQPPRQVVERWTVLSQDEHPALGHPFSCLHPCGTAGRMRHLLMPPPLPSREKDDEGSWGLAYLIKWFGLVAPVVGLPYPAAFAQRVLSCGAGEGNES